jgi:hypothetical protein
MKIIRSLNKILKLNFLSTIIYLILGFILYLILPIFSAHSFISLILAILGNIVVFLFLIAIIYTLAGYLLKAKPANGFKKFILKTFLAILAIPALASVIIDLFRLVIIETTPGSGYGTQLGYDMSRGAVWLFALIWLMVVCRISTKKVSNKKEKKLLIFTIIIAIIILYFILH